MTEKKDDTLTQFLRNTVGHGSYLVVGHYISFSATRFQTSAASQPCPAVEIGPCFDESGLCMDNEATKRTEIGWISFASPNLWRDFGSGMFTATAPCSQHFQ